MYMCMDVLAGGGREARRRTGCIQNENPHIGEWWEKVIGKEEEASRENSGEFLLKF